MADPIFPRILFLFMAFSHGQDNFYAQNNNLHRVEVVAWGKLPMKYVVHLDKQRLTRIFSEVDLHIASTNKEELN